MDQIFSKLETWGAGRLTDCELLSLLVGDEHLAETLLAQYGDDPLARIGDEEVARLRMVGGLGIKRAQMLLAAVEFGRRVVAAKSLDGEVVRTSDDVARHLRLKISGLAHEECWVVYLTSANRVIEHQRVSQGGVQGTVVDHRLIVKRALELLATQLILVHNHPSGAAEPSSQDKVLTEKIARAAALFDIRLLDHLILSREGDFSFQRAGLLQ